ncbi:MAG: hypothetical protein U1F43_06140 [Myxococcota bacterium]
MAFVGLRFGWDEPRFITAAEADTVLGGIDLARALSDDGPDAPASIVQRLKLGFEPHEGNPRLAELPGDAAFRRAVVEAPLPRWLAAAGIGVLPSPEDTPNLARAASSSAVAVALAVVLMALIRRRRWGLFALAAPALLLALPGVLDAGVSAGYGASAILVMAALAAAVERLHASGRGALVVGALVGLAAAVHPIGLALVVPVLAAYAVARRPDATSIEDESGGSLRLPAAPLALLALPIIAVIVLVLAWPELWSETGKRLGSWLLDFAQSARAKVEVAGLTYDPQPDRVAPAWSAFLQWVAWTPYPIVGLWVAGVGKAIRDGRDGAWFPIAAWLTLLVGGALDGGLFGARASLLPLLWVPTALTAAEGLDAVRTWARERLAGLPRAATLAARAAALALGVAVAWQALASTTWGAASQTGSEPRYALSLALIDTVEASEPGGIVAVVQGPPEQYAPQLEVARHQLERDIRPGEPANASWIITVGDLGPDGEKALAGLTEVQRDGRGGVHTSLWRRTGRDLGRH